MGHNVENSLINSTLLHGTLENKLEECTIEQTSGHNNETFLHIESEIDIQNFIQTQISQSLCFVNLLSDVPQHI